MIASCAGPISPDGDGEETGSIEGHARFQGEADHSGIVITAEAVTGGTAATVSASLASRHSQPRAVAAQVTTNEEGHYELVDLAPGQYTVYASSQHSREGAVAVGVDVVAAQSVSAGDLLLTPTGSISGQATLDGAASGNLGIAVFIAGTSYMALTDDAGDFLITGVPADSGYQLVARMDGYEDASAQVDGAAAAQADAGTLDLTPLLPAPTGLFAMSEGFREILLLWNETSPMEEGFEVHRRTPFGSFSLVATLSADTTAFLDSGLNEGMRYTYRVRAYQGAESSPYSPEAEAATDRRIAYYSNRDGNMEIYVMNADGSGQTNLTTDGGYDQDPAW